MKQISAIDYSHALNLNHTKTNQRLFKALMVGCMLLISSHAFALDDDYKKPISIDADQGSFEKGNMETVFKGNVVITQGSLLIHAAETKINVLPNKVQVYEAKGNPVRFQQKINQNGNIYNLKGKANHVTYNNGTGISVLLGNAEIINGDDLVRGNRIEYDVKAQKYKVIGSRKRQIRVVIDPNRK